MKLSRWVLLFVPIGLIFMSLISFNAEINSMKPYMSGAVLRQKAMMLREAALVNLNSTRIDSIKRKAMDIKDRYAPRGTPPKISIPIAPNNAPGGEGAVL